MSDPARTSTRRVLGAAVTPLASIFGSGFLIIVPVLERVLGRQAVIGAAAACALAWFIGTAIRHNIRVIESQTLAGNRPAELSRLEWAADAVIVVAYIISVALYLRIMAQYLVGYFIVGGSQPLERAIACTGVAAIITVGITRGFPGLERLERIALLVVLILTAVLGFTLLAHDVNLARGPGLTLPPVPGLGLGEVLLVLGGMVITVQGFETVRYLGDQYDAETRVWSSRVAQLVATAVYLPFVLVATPLMGLGTSQGPDDTLLGITARAAPVLAIPLVLTAVLSQFSAATADTVAAEGNLRGLSRWMRGPRPYLISGVTAVLLAATVGTFAIIAIASRAFAAYYAIQCVLALRSTSSSWARIGYGTLTLVLVAITLLAQPAG